jgi:hypothetical protein
LRHNNHIFFHYVPLNYNRNYVHSHRVQQYHALLLFTKTNL